MMSPMDLVNKAKSQITECECSELTRAINNDEIIIDVREPSEYEGGHIGTAINIPRGLLEFSIMNHPNLKDKLTKQGTETPIYLYCKSGGRSALAALSLQEMGYTNVISVAGGYEKWVSNA